MRVHKRVKMKKSFLLVFVVSLVVDYSYAGWGGGGPAAPDNEIGDLTGIVMYIYIYVYKNICLKLQYTNLTYFYFNPSSSHHQVHSQGHAVGAQLARPATCWGARTAPSRAVPKWSRVFLWPEKARNNSPIPFYFHCDSEDTDMGGAPLSSMLGTEHPIGVLSSRLTSYLCQCMLTCTHSDDS